MSNDEIRIPWGKVAGVLVLLLIVGLGLDWIGAGENFFLYKYWAPKQEQVRRQVYEGTKSYHQGSVQRLNTLCTQVADADADHKPMINDVISHEFAEWSSDDVPDYLRPCLTTARAKNPGNQ